MSRARTRARHRAIQGLYQWQMSGQSAEQIEAQFNETQDMKGVEIRYFRDLLYKVPTHVAELDDAIAPHLDRSLDSLDPVERAILRLATYELTYRQDVPFRVVINEAVDAAKVFGAESSHRYINGVLDKVAKARAIEST